jgi:hypothetical protein
VRPQEEILGICFADGEPAANKIKEWIDSYLGLR